MFPSALVERINSLIGGSIRVEGITAELVRVGGVEMERPCPYAVIVDRTLHDISLYRAYLIECGADRDGGDSFPVL